MKISIYSCVLLTVLSWVQAQTGSSSRPNIVVIYTDDQGYQDLGCFGSTRVSTPRIDQMANEGMKLTDFYMAGSVCTPSRASLLTGSYPIRNGIADQILLPGDEFGLHPDEVTIAEILLDAGYRTGMFGKWHLGDQPEFLPTAQGFEEFFGFPYGHDMNNFHPLGGVPPYNWQALPLINQYQVVEANPDAKYLTQRFTERAVEFIEEHSNEPFFLYLPHPMPHRPLYAREEFLDAGELALQQQIDANEAGGDFVDYERRDNLYLAAVEELDWSVGEILDALDQQGIADNTIVVFTSDNGPASSAIGSAAPLRGKKASSWDGGHRVPTVVRWPDAIPAGIESDELLTGMDLLPTFANLAGAQLPTDRVIDGKDITAVLTDGAESPHDAFFYYRHNNLQAVRSGKWKLRNGALYDLETNIGETINRAAANPDIVSDLNTLITDFQSSLVGNTRPLGSSNDTGFLSLGDDWTPAGVRPEPTYKPIGTKGGVLVNNEALIPIDPITLTGDFTIESWIYFDEKDEITNKDGLVASASASINFGQGSLQVFDANSGGLKLSANTASDAGEWIHYAVVRNFGVVQLFINGELDATSSTTWNSNFLINHIAAGRSGVQSGTGLNGMMDDLMIWNTARSLSQIEDDMRGIVENTGGLLRRYNFEEGGAKAIVNGRSLPMNPITLTGDFTIQSLIYFNEGEEINNEDGIVASTTQDINFWQGKAHLYAGSTRRNVVIANTTAQPGEWALYTFVRKDGILKLYINGKLDATAGRAWSAAFTVDNYGTGIAGLRNGTGLSGELANLHVWDYALSSQQIKSVSNNTRSSLVDITGNSETIELPAEAEVMTVGNSNYLDVNQAILSTNAVVLPGDFTVASWVYFDEEDGISNEDGLVASAKQDINFFSKRIRVYDQNAGGNQVAANTASTPGVWTHYAIVRSSGITSIYVDGLLDATATTSWNRNFIIGYIGLGVHGVDIQEGLSGYLDDFAIWDIALTASQINTHKNGAIPQLTHALVSYDFSGIGPVILDNSGNENNLYIYSGAVLENGSVDNNSNARLAALASNEPSDELAPVIVYPNPASKTIQVTFETDLPSQLEIISLTGKVLLTTVYSGESQVIDVQNLPSGAYILRVSNAEEIISKQLLIE